MTRPTPKPPRDVRPISLSVTEIETWLRDPYSIYARHVLRLQPLNEVDTPPGARDRGTVIHGAIAEFTETYLAAGGHEGMLSTSRRKRKERGIWQRRFWDHVIRDELDFERHLDYIHYNPVKHGYVQCPCDWPYSSFQRWVERGVYESNWGCTEISDLKFDDLDETAME